MDEFDEIYRYLMAYVMIFVFCLTEVRRDFQSIIFPNNIIVF